jgi:iron complex outermembrane recepter protein
VNNQMNHIASKLSYGLLGGVSVLALSLASPAMAQDTQTIETVTITGQRASIESAIRIKENADQIVDSIVADDAGKLPDRSITEVLQRVSGVTITHFNNAGAPDTYTVEGSGPTVRGLPGGTSTINGHSSFSAKSGREILWGDVPSELMAAVDVFKTYTADQIEGGLGGTINLRTHLPFDFDGTRIAGRVGLSYGDLIKQARPVGSAMISTRWNTGIGEMGLLVSLSYDDSSYRNDSILSGAYIPHTNVIDDYHLTYTGGVPSGVAQNTNPTTYFLPVGFAYATNWSSHQRGGGNVAFQWRPNDRLLIHARVFSSVNETTTNSYKYEADANGANANITLTDDATRLGILSGSTPTASDPTYHTWDSNNYLLQSNTYMNAVTGKSTAKATTQVQRQFSRTTDIELGADWAPNDNWQVRASADFIYSKASFQTLLVEADAEMPDFGINMSSTYPTFIFSDVTQLRTSSNYHWGNTMTDKNRNHGQEIQTSLDVTYHVNRGIFKDIKFGLRGDVRTERDQDTGYSDWTVLSASWHQPEYFFSSVASAKDTVLYQFPNFFRGEVNLPGQALFVSADKVGMLSAAYFQNQYNCSYNNTGDCTAATTPYADAAYTPYNTSNYMTANVAAYAMVTFAKDSVFGMPMSGNIGARLVYVDNQARGYQSTYGSSVYVKDGVTYATSANPVQIAGGRVSWTLLPSFNIQVMPTEQIHIRLAGSITAQQPHFAGIYGTNSVGAEDTTKAWTSFNLGGDNPRIKPEIGRNLDLSFEWYGNGADAHLSLFYKSIKGKTTTAIEMRHLAWSIGQPVTNTAGTDCASRTSLQECASWIVAPSATMVDTVSRTTVNSDKEAVIRGVEIGFTKYFDWNFVPAYLKGFGFAGNYTYIDSRFAGSYALDMFGNNIASRLPMEGLSHHSYNAQLMYDRDPISFRLAYNWRSRYLMLASGYNTSASYLGSASGVTCHINNTAALGWGGNVQEGTCNYALPVWSKSFGSLDAGLDYSVDDHWRLSIQSQNLLNTKEKTTMGINMAAYTDATGVARPAQEERSRGWFVADRRVSIDLRFSY